MRVDFAFGKTGLIVDLPAGLQYRVLDTSGASMSIAGMTITESVSPDNGTCHSTIVDSSSWSTDSTGTMIGLDGISTCCNGNTCQVSYSQTFTVNGFGVLIMSQDGGTTGTHNAISIVCTSGSGACPRIAITP